MMRALGPQSVSSFLKTALDVVYAGAVASVAVVGPCGLALLVLSPIIGAQGASLFGIKLALRPAALSAALLTLAVYLGFLIYILDRLRKVAKTLTEGDPFQPENVGRLRLIGLGLIGLEAANMPLRAALNWMAPSRAGAIVSFNLTAWFAVLVVFVLAEVFREGARLRREAELTI
jgi:hypothetical protein